MTTAGTQPRLSPACEVWRHLGPWGLQTPPFQPGPAEASVMVRSCSLPALLLQPKFLARQVKKHSLADLTL